MGGNLIIDEQLLSPFREIDGFCYLSRNYGEFPNYENYSELVEHLKSIQNTPTLLRVPNFKPTKTYLEFSSIWSNENLKYQTVPVLAFTAEVPILLERRTWRLLEHQCAGHHCNHLAMIATILKPKAKFETAFNKIAKDNFYALNGWFDGPERDATITQQYLSEIDEIGLTCSEFALQHLRESLYPIDATAHTLQKISENSDELVDFLEISDARPVILFLSENSD
ncbi:MAG: hypothetical protein AAF362_11895 [Pseudomonadota bacterium]